MESAKRVGDSRWHDTEEVSRRFFRISSGGSAKALSEKPANGTADERKARSEKPANATADERKDQESTDAARSARRKITPWPIAENENVESPDTHND